MVHALKELWRVLTPHGYLIDLRPRAASWPMEVVTSTKAWVAGRVDNAPFIPDELAADTAIGQVEQEGLFVREQRRFFDCASYWNTIDDMLVYYAESISPPLVIPDKVLSLARQRVETASERTRVRIRIRMLIARYRKQFTS